MDENSLSAILTMLNAMLTRVEAGGNPWFES